MTKFLQDPKACKDLKLCLHEKLSAMSKNEDSIMKLWKGVKTASHMTYAESLRYTTCQHQDWVNESNTGIQPLLDQKKRTHSAWQHDTSSQQK